MNSKQFIRHIRKLAGAANRLVTVSGARGKGGHVMVTVGMRSTTVPTGSGDIPPPLRRRILRQLDLE